MRNLTILLLVATLFQSCSYDWETGLTQDGKQIRYKVYKKPAVATAKRNQSVFDNRDDIEPPSRYRGVISSDTTHNYTFVQFDSVRVYLYDKSGEFKDIFTSGLVSGQMLYSGDTLTKKDTVRHKWDVWGWKGQTIMVGNFELLTDVKSKPTERRFKFYAESRSRPPYVQGSDVFFLELTNDKATRKTDLHAFLKSARVTLLKWAWFEI